MNKNILGNNNDGQVQFCKVVLHVLQTNVDFTFMFSALKWYQVKHC